MPNDIQGIAKQVTKKKKPSTYQDARKLFFADANETSDSTNSFYNKADKLKTIESGQMPNVAKKYKDIGQKIQSKKNYIGQTKDPKAIEKRKKDLQEYASKNLPNIPGVNKGNWLAYNLKKSSKGVEKEGEKTLTDDTFTAPGIADANLKNLDIPKIFRQIQMEQRQPQKLVRGKNKGISPLLKPNKQVTDALNKIKAKIPQASRFIKALMAFGGAYGG